MELERRYLLRRPQVLDVFTLIADQIKREVHDPERPVSFTRTTYLDTTDLEYLRSYFRPVTRRLRVRQYAGARTEEDAPRFSSPCFLELKESFGATRGKLRIPMAPQLLPRLLDGTEDLTRLAAAQCVEHPPLARVASQLSRGRLRPVLTTWYRRRSYVGESGRVRITLDESLAYVDGKPYGFLGARATPANVVAHGPEWILELKCKGATPGWLVDALAALREAGAFSKYRAGMTMLHRAQRAA